MLHITNGDSVVTTFRQARFPGKYLSWADVMHDGPVPDLPTLEELSEVRARTLAGFGAGSYDKVRARFAERDRMLAEFRLQEEVVLWFEHDLTDQLQVLQLLDYFYAHDPGKTRLSLIQINEYPGVQPFFGLGQLSARQLARLFPLRQVISNMQLSVGKEVWRAFRAPDPNELFGLVEKEFPEMPFLRAALLRFFEEFPSAQDGLSRTQWQILKAVEAGARTKGNIYMSSSKGEACPWGDASVFLRIEGLASGPQPALLKKSADSFELTAAGRELLAGKADWATLNGGLDVWLGGTHLTGEPAWRWDGEAHALVPGKTPA
jgi:hypothetical protein